MSKKIFITCLFLIVAFFTVYTPICYATAVPVTKENLTTSIQQFADESQEINIEVLDEIIKVSMDGEEVNLDYDLTNKPVFSIKIPIQKGISYEEFQEKTNMGMMPLLGYLAVANIEGASFEDAMTYFMFTYLDKALDTSVSSNSYQIIDDLDVSEGVTIEKGDNPNVIYTSEFGDRVMEYLDAMFPEEQSITDSEELNSYKLTIKKQNVSDTLCDLIYTLTVNHDADFSKIEGTSEKLAEERGESLGEAVKKAEESTKEASKKEEELASGLIDGKTMDEWINGDTEKSDKSKVILPKAGSNQVLLITIMIVTISAVAFKIVLKGYKDIK